MHEAPSRAASSRGSRRFLDMLAMGRAVARRGLDLMYFPATYSFFPVWNAGKLVVTMHDTLPLAHPELVFPNRRGRLAWQIKETARCDWPIASSRSPKPRAMTSPPGRACPHSESA